MNFVYLDTKYNEYYVDEETYATIGSLVQQHKCCLFDSRNRHPYTADNPCVGRNICLEHLLQKQPHLTRIEVVGATSENRSIYYFVDKQGFVYTSTEDRSDEAARSLDDTLTYYGFMPPKTITSRGKSVSFYSYYASLHGDLPTASVIVLSFNHTSEKVKGLFLLYKNGQPKEFSKKNDIYHQADALVEASKDAQGNYHLGGYAHYGKHESDTLAVISQLESAIYDVTLRLKNGQSRTDNQSTY